MNKTVIILGGGPAGYVGAIRAAQLGATVHLVEKEKVGGTCLNVGCIPTKTLLATASLYHKLRREGQDLGLMETGQLKVDWPTLQKRKQRIVSGLVGGVGGLLKANGVILHQSSGRLLDQHQVCLESGETINGDYLLLATGSRPAVPPFPGHDLPQVIDSTAALSLPCVPERIVILGGGVIGVEFAYLFRALGAEVRIIEMLPQILTGVDWEIADILRRSLVKDGVQIHTQARLERVEQSGQQIQAFYSDGQVLKTLKADYLLVAVGRRPASAGIGLERAGVRTEKDFVLVDEHFRTNIPHIYAVGDINGRKMLAHAASAQAVAAAEHCLLGKPVRPAAIPACIYAEPEIGSVGMSEEEAKAAGIPYKVGCFPLSANGKAAIEGNTDGLVKVIVGQPYGDILGVHIIGPHATEMIAEASLALSMEACVEDVAATVHPHPSVSETIAEAMLDADRQAIHWPPKR